MTDPWASGHSEQRSLTRADRVHAAALAEHRWSLDLGYEHAEWDALPGYVQLQYDDSAEAALDAAYPQASTAAGLDAWPPGALIVSDAGRVLRRYERTRKSARVWGQPDIFASSVDRYYTSAEIAGPVWTLVHRVAS